MHLLGRDAWLPRKTAALLGEATAVRLSPMRGMTKSYQREWCAMSETQKRTFSLPAEHARFIDDQVKKGAYASGSEVVRAGLRALQERDAAVERWLREEVAPAYDAMKAAPTRAIPIAEAFRTVRRRHAARVKSRS